MSCERIDRVLEHSRQRGSCLLVLVIIAFYSDQNGEWIIDQATLQRLARLGRRRIQQILRRLAEAGELAVVSHFGRGKLSTYRLLVGEKEEAPPAAPCLPWCNLISDEPRTAMLSQPPQSLQNPAPAGPEPR